LFRDFGILASNLVELGGVAQQADPEFAQAFGSNNTKIGLARVCRLDKTRNNGSESHFVVGCGEILWQDTRERESKDGELGGQVGAGYDCLSVRSPLGVEVTN
jgi:hypothetical protein